MAEGGEQQPVPDTQQTPVKPRFGERVSAGLAGLRRYATKVRYGLSEEQMLANELFQAKLDQKLKEREPELQRHFDEQRKIRLELNAKLDELQEQSEKDWQRKQEEEARKRAAMRAEIKAQEQREKAEAEQKRQTRIELMREELKNLKGQ